MVYVEALSKALPAILLFLLGAFLNKLRFIRSEAIRDGVWADDASPC